MDFKFYKYFLNFLVGLAFISLNIINQYAHAKDLSDLSELSRSSSEVERNLSVGIEGLYMISHYKNDWNKVFRKNQGGVNIYAGYNWQYIMLEMGYSWTGRRAKEFFLDDLATLFGQTNNPINPGADAATVISGQVRFRSTHFDLNFFSNAFGNFDVVTSIGISFARPHITIYTSNSNSSIGFQLRDIVDKTTAVPRAGLGLRYLFTDTFGVRGMWHFDKNSKISLRSDPAVFGLKPFRDANTFSLGVFGRI